MEFILKLVSHTHRSAVFFLGLTAAAAGGNAFAQTSPETGGVTLAAGAWSTTVNSTINGRNSSELLQKVQASWVKMLPAGMKENTSAQMNPKSTRVKATTCITSQTAAAVGSPAALFNTMSKMNPRCTFKAGKLTATTQQFTGNCYDPASFSGNVSGKVIVDSPTSWRSTFSGSGKVPATVLQALSLPTGSLVQMQTTVNSTFASTSCPLPAVAVASAR